MIAKQEVKELEKSQVELTVTVEQSALQDAYDKVLAKYMKSVQLPGFRKGKAPKSVLENKIGEGMREESVYTVIDEAVQKAIADVDQKYRPLPYSTPALQNEDDIPTEIDKDLVFSVKYDVLPQFDLPAYTEQEVDVEKVVISDETVNAEIEKLRDQNAMVIEKDKDVEKDDIITIDYVELDENDEEVAGTSRKDFVFTVGSGTNFYKIDDDVIGMKKGETKVISKTFGDDHEVEEYRGKSVKLSVTLNTVKVRDVPDLDDEFAQDVAEEYKTVEDLVKGTKEKLEKNLEGHLKETKLNTLLDALLEKVDFEVPASMIEAEVDSSWRRFVSQSGMNEEQVLQYLSFSGQTKESFTEGWREPAEKNLKIQLIIEKIKEKENFEVTEEELAEQVEQQLKDITDENTKNYYKEMLKDDLQTRKASDFLLEKNTFKESKEVSYDEFMSSHQH
ncbi:MAG: trigger factor [Sphaerochaetaceae bacterium]|nr:trigger factor [Sphaerochaetaceae bacterium]